MSDRPIQVGDLVVVVRNGDYCGCQLGATFLVSRFEAGQFRWNCAVCVYGGVNNDRVWVYGAGHTQPLSVLKRIPPLSELEGQRTEERIIEPLDSDTVSALDKVLAYMRKDGA